MGNGTAGHVQKRRSIPLQRGGGGLGLLKALIISVNSLFLERCFKISPIVAPFRGDFVADLKKKKKQKHKDATRGNRCSENGRCLLC